MQLEPARCFAGSDHTVHRCEQRFGVHQKLEDEPLHRELESRGQLGHVAGRRRHHGFWHVVADDAQQRFHGCRFVWRHQLQLRWQCLHHRHRQLNYFGRQHCQQQRKSFHEPSGGFDLWLENHSVFFGEFLQPTLFGLEDLVLIFFQACFHIAQAMHHYAPIKLCQFACQRHVGHQAPAPTF